MLPTGGWGLAILATVHTAASAQIIAPVSELPTPSANHGDREEQSMHLKYQDPESTSFLGQPTFGSTNPTFASAHARPTEEAFSVRALSTSAFISIHDGESTDSTSLFTSVRIGAIGLGPTKVGNRTILATIISPTSTADVSYSQLSVHPLPTASDQPVCDSIFRDEYQKHSRIYCNAALSGEHPAPSNSSVSFLSCIESCNANDDCNVASFVNTTNSIGGFCRLNHAPIDNVHNGQSATRLVWQLGNHLAWRVSDPPDSLPDAPVEPPAIGSATSNPLTRLVPSLQPSLDPPTIVSEAGISALSTGVAYGFSVSIITATPETTSSSLNVCSATEQVTITSSLGPLRLIRISRSTTKTTSSDHESNTVQPTSSSSRGPLSVSRLPIPTKTITSFTTSTPAGASNLSREQAATASAPLRVTRVSRSTAASTSSAVSTLAGSSSPSREQAPTTSTPIRVTRVSRTSSMSSTSVSSRTPTSLSSTRISTMSSTLSILVSSRTSISSTITQTPTPNSAPQVTSTTSPSNLPASRTGDATSRRSSPPPISSSTVIAPRLSNPTLVGTGADETQYGITLPFSMSLFTQMAQNLAVTTNGILSLGDQSLITEGYTDGGGYPSTLPTYELIPGTAVVWWQYLESLSTPGLGIYYQIDGGAKLSVEWLMRDNGGLLTNVVLTYDATRPGSVRFYYFSDGDSGANSTVGVQGLDTSNNFAAVTFEAGVPKTLRAGLMLSFTTNPTQTATGMYVQTSFNLNCFPAGSFPEGICDSPAV